MSQNSDRPPNNLAAPSEHIMVPVHSIPESGGAHARGASLLRTPLMRQYLALLKLDPAARAEGGMGPWLFECTVQQWPCAPALRRHLASDELSVKSVGSRSSATAEQRRRTRII